MSDQSQDVAKVPKEDLLNFNPTGRCIAPDELEHEFRLMKQAAIKGKGKNYPGVFREVVQKSGTHLIKLVSPRADGGAPVLRCKDSHNSRRLPLIPAVNAADIPYAKVLFRPLEIRGETARCLVDHARNPSDISERVLEAFARVFGEDAREAVLDALNESPPAVEKLAAGEFPIIFVPCPDGGDLQITPISPAAAYKAMKRVTEPYFQKQSPGGPRVPRGRWHRQKVSGKPQNISGAIGGPRVRFLAEMPSGMAQMESELFRFIHGGRFPRWRDPDIAKRILQYADLLDRDKEYDNRHTRAELDSRADRLIAGASRFAAEAMEGARALADRHGISPDAIESPPDAGHILFRRHWPGNGEHRKARNTLASKHFRCRLRKFSNRAVS